MSTEFEYDVFLSYSSKDKGYMHVLSERLKGEDEIIIMGVKA